MKRKLFSELSPVTYEISVKKNIWQRKLRDFIQAENLAQTKNAEPLPVSVYKHTSLIHRKLGNTDLVLQENKAINLRLAAPKISHILIKPNETFSFWHLVGKCSVSEGYKEGVTIFNDAVRPGLGGGLCQFTNLIHWIILHSPLEITEHHHHDGLDLFPDYGRKIPFGTGTSIVYNYLDYRFKNNTKDTYQLIISVSETHLNGELRSDNEQTNSYHIRAKNEYFSRENGQVFRNGQIFRKCIDKRTGNLLENLLIKENHARVVYDTTHLDIKETD
ncbi:vancomycin resistance protein [Enterococcus ureilyticus]|uniref:Vancomycin resistance protein n=1 Tax=Enterococcus ureilyticus TaxID=1131292 RepID=A0A1E5HEW8_9ENTE|nr:VanW family protein [Enterococcus ureilyticus]MBM7687336.1 vancomycin resistance protein VanW [Enterococcus ureilyticus]MBO0447572.1 VanW family protein [Enterococcus ureilyticus]OEG23396.1 vancomycin resistance protein [Enterococcus ureilyticus]